MLEFRKLNLGWNAEPNCPVPLIRLQGDDVLLEFVLNAFIYKQFAEEECGILRFSGCSRYRLGGTNDEGWWMGQCRYSKLAPYWGEFYELIGDDPLRDQPTDWVLVGHSQRSRHFLFYFRDDTFECVADDWRSNQVTRFIVSSNLRPNRRSHLGCGGRGDPHPEERACARLEG